MSALNFRPSRALLLRRPRSHGFSLFELALVLCVLSLLIGGSLLPLNSRLQARQLSLARSQLHDIVDALHGYALIHGRLPCALAPAMADTAANALASPCAHSDSGLLPWRSLGVSAHDPWGQPWHYQPDRNFTEAPITASTTPLSQLQVADVDGSALTLSDSPAVAVVFSSGVNRRPDGANADSSSARFTGGSESGESDDLLIWLGRPILLARLAQGGRL